MTNGSVKTFKSKAFGFDQPTQLPRDAAEHERWQTANRAWWEAAPMRYDWRAELDERVGTKAYFQEIDRRFIESAKGYLSSRRIPFDDLIPFAELGDKNVLEIGVGHGTHAQLLAPHCRSFVGIDLTRTAAAMTAKRFALFGMPGSVLQMDAERLAFADASFDYIWSWGVIHHSADTRRVLVEMHRVLRPGGGCTLMVYYRSWWNYYVSGFLRRAFLALRRGIHQASASNTDGAIARYYTPMEWRALTKDLFVSRSIRIYGMKSDLVLLPYGRLKRAVMTILPNSLARFMTGRLRMGSFLVATMDKPKRQ